MDATQFGNTIKKLALQANGQMKQALLTNTPASDLNYMSQYSQTLPIGQRYQYITSEWRVLSNYQNQCDAVFIATYVGDTNPWLF